MRLIDTVNNIKSYNGWEYRNYALTKAEADVLIEAAEKVLEDQKKLEDDGR